MTLFFKCFFVGDAYYGMRILVCRVIGEIGSGDVTAWRGLVAGAGAELSLTDGRRHGVYEVLYEGTGWEGGVLGT